MPTYTTAGSQWLRVIDQHIDLDPAAHVLTMLGDAAKSELSELKAWADMNLPWSPDENDRDDWSPAPIGDGGDCESIAIATWLEAIRRGLPAGAFSLALCTIVSRSGREDHANLLVHMEDGRLVLDNKALVVVTPTTLVEAADYRFIARTDAGRRDWVLMGNENE